MTDVPLVVTIPRPWWPVTISASALGAMTATLLSPGPPLQPALVLWFLLVCPGMAFVRLLRLPSRVLEWTLASAMSIALGVVVAQTLLYAGYWSPSVGLAALAALSLVGAALQLRAKA